MRIEARAEAMQEADRAHGGRCRSGGAGLPEGGLEGPEEDVKDGAGGPGSVMEEGAEAFGNGEDELAHRHVGNDVVHQVGGRLGHALGAAGGAGAPALAGERDEEVVPTGGASDPSEAVGQDAALQVAPEFLFHVIRYAVADGAHGIGLMGQGEVGLQVLPDDAMQRGGLGTASAIGPGMSTGRWSGRWSGPPGIPLSGAGLCGHRQPLASRGVRRSVSTSRTAKGWGGGMG